jgi:hypothetical protein
MRTQMLLSIGLVVAGMMLPIGCSTAPQASDDRVEPISAVPHKAGVAPRTAKTPGVSEPQRASTTLPIGTVLLVRTTSTLSTRTQQAGQTFVTHLEQPVMHNGVELFPKGAMVEGTVIDSDEGGRVKGLAILAVQLTQLHARDGQALRISTNSIAVEARSTKGKDAVKVGVGSGVGAAIGAIAGGAKGAAIGAAAGAGAGAGVVLATHGDSAVILSESVLQFTLNSAVLLPG